MAVPLRKYCVEVAGFPPDATDHEELLGFLQRELAYHGLPESGVSRGVGGGEPVDVPQRVRLLRHAALQNDVVVGALVHLRR